MGREQGVLTHHTQPRPQLKRSPRLKHIPPPKTHHVVEPVVHKDGAGKRPRVDVLAGHAHRDAFLQFEWGAAGKVNGGAVVGRGKSIQQPQTQATRAEPARAPGVPMYPAHPAPCWPGGRGWSRRGTGRLPAAGCPAGRCRRRLLAKRIYFFRRRGQFANGTILAPLQSAITAFATESPHPHLRTQPPCTRVHQLVDAVGVVLVRPADDHGAHHWRLQLAARELLHLGGWVSWLVGWLVGLGGWIVAGALVC